MKLKMSIIRGARAAKFALVGSSLDELMFRLSLAIALSAILVIGPHFQMFVVALISSDQSAVYDTLYKGQISFFMTYAEWLETAFDPLYLAIATSTVWLAVRVLRARSIFIHASALLFLLISASDIIGNALLAPEASVSAIENLLSNAVGSPIIAAILVLICHAAEVAKRYATSRLAGRVVAVVAPILIGLVVTSTFYLIARTLYAATPASLDVTVEAPVHGHYGSGNPERKGASHQTNEEKFGLFLAKNESDRRISWTGMAEGYTLNWTRPSAARNEYRGELQLFEGCYSYEMIENAKSNPRPLRFTKLNDFAVKIDSGLSQFKVASRGQVRASDDALNMFSVEVEPKERLRITLFIDPTVTIKHSNWRGDAKYFFLAWLTNGKRPSPRTLEFRINNETKGITFEPPISMPRSAPVNCKPIQVDLTREKVIALGQPVVSGILTIRPPNSDELFAEDVDFTTVSGLNGWFNADELPRSQLGEYVQAGKLSTLLFEGKVASAFIDGQRYEPRISDRLQATNADLIGMVTPDNRFRFYGEADAIFFNGQRVNQTRWEKIDFGWKVIFLGAVPGLLLFFANAFRHLIRRDEAFESLGNP